MEYGDGGGGGVTKKVVWVDSSCVLVAFNQCMRHAGSGYDTRGEAIINMQQCRILNTSYNLTQLELYFLAIHPASRNLL